VGGADSVLIDDKGRPWQDGAWDLARRIGYSHPTLDLVSFAVRERGFVHLRPQDGGVRVALRAGGFGLAALAGALFIVKDRKPQRILLAIFDGDGWQYEMLANVWEFAERTEQLARGGPVRSRYRWLAAERNLKSLSLPGFASARAVVRLWQECHARMPDDLPGAIGQMADINRMVLVRRPAGTSRLLVEHFGAAISVRQPCDAFLAVGRDFEDLPDRDYGNWAAEAYIRSLSSDRLCLQSVNATVRRSEATTVVGRYDRLLMPWRGSGDDRFVMCMSIRRKLSFVA
jgi:hypothetical protein